MSNVEIHTTRSASIRRLWPLALLLLLVAGLAGCAEPEEEEAVGEGEVGAEEEAVGEDETPGFGLVALVGAVAAVAIALRRR